ncbi:DUF4256 domain-containing protein [Erysipelothrix rhusiopathiae]|uniref:DUF4256 domain-containing protein n=1 Tax=Erysipelothrix rhusiopathiae TaxID=1648 RepID=UPI000F436281|nr:DUF4256 domain-containing protein [Erysipelothrix rhusiopathiae]AYV34717.1 DUF4256 domain-containing protein [Erysipelothrix rhusiopathiae]MDE8081327.1 DUF4256 domain-containing protein [Erysipelothrix rhusiopathiae]MDE8329964.1 DUF4256 domain-containing protein [Erysipelothrix rhusiopathiae]MDE8333644.1 DUF4256 domain-containing protein [Erysipelothrix rhusiopathiae]
MNQKELLVSLQERFEMNEHRHPTIVWDDVLEGIQSNSHVLDSLLWMEETQGEPDLFVLDDGSWIYMDCAPESPVERRSLCYDALALEQRKKNKPSGSAVQIAQEAGVRLLDETLYRFLQNHDVVDQKTSSWIETPTRIRELGGALFGDYRYGTVFIYHNGADSYYAARGFRTYLKIK